MISEDVIQKVIEQNNIVDIVSERVRLKRKGRNYFGLCPFHNEKTPSFSVSADKQIYKCFGCGEAGNVITFVMKTKNLSFPEAVSMLAERVNIRIQPQNDNQVRQETVNQKIYKLNLEVARYFFNNLKKNKRALSYFFNRGIKKNILRRFGLGYAVDSWNSLLNYLKGKGYSELDMVTGGVIVEGKNGSFYDRFRNRVIFPVFDYKGRVIGFGGRVLDDSKPKYLNSPETLVFKKGINLYGLNFAIKKNNSRTFIIVEGYMDCIALHQCEITNVVASLGTALTVNQAKILKRYADKVIISYDSDAAGQLATLRGLDILKNQGFDVRVLVLPKGKDPDEFIKANGKEAFLGLVDNSLPLVDYKINKAKEGLNLKNSKMLVTYVQKSMNIIKKLDPIEKAVYIKKISEETGIKEQAIYDLANKMQKNVKTHKNMNIPKNFGQKLYLEPSYVKAERSLLKLMFVDEKAFEYILENIQEDQLIMESHKKIYTYIVECIDCEKNNRKIAIESKCKDLDTSKEWVNILEIKLVYDKSNVEEIINDYINQIKKNKLERSKKQIMNKIKKYELQGKITESLQLAQELLKIQKEIGGIE